MQEELVQLNEGWNSAWLRKDAVTVEGLMTPDYVYVAPNGQALDRAAILAIIRSPTFRLEGGTRTEVRVTSLGQDSAVVMHRWQGVGTYEGKAFTDDHRCTMVCVRRGSKWQAAWEHCSLITK